MLRSILLRRVGLALAMALWLVSAPRSLPSAAAQARQTFPSAPSGQSGSAVLADVVADLPRRHSAAGGAVGSAAGDDEQFWAFDFASHRYYLARATRVHSSAVLNLYVEQGQRVAPPVLAGLAALFEDQVYPRLRNRFGPEPEPGIDGERAITILLLDIRDPYGAGSAPHTLYAGYFDPTNQVAQADLNADPERSARRSNEREMLYLDVSPTDPESLAFRQSLAHEFAHLITWNHDPDEVHWLSEGLSELGIYDAGLGHPVQHVEAFLRDPDSSLTTFEDTPRDYGKVYLFLLYLQEQAERAAASGDTTAGRWPMTLVQDPGNGLASVQATLPVARPLGELFRDYAVAAQVDDPDLSDGRFGFRSLDLGLPADGIRSFRAMAVHTRAQYPLNDAPVTLAPWSIRADLFVGGRGDVDVIIAAPRDTCAAAVGLRTLGRAAPGTANVQADCTGPDRPALGWAFPDFRTHGRTAAILAVTANASDEPLTLGLSALPPLGSLRWAPEVYLPIAVR
jgi:hypothetical protein